MSSVMINPKWISRHVGDFGSTDHRAGAALRASDELSRSVLRASLASCECGAKDSLGGLRGQPSGRVHYLMSHMLRRAGSELLPLQHAALLWLTPVFIRNAQPKLGLVLWDHVIQIFFFQTHLVQLISGQGPKHINNATCLQGQTVRNVLTPSGPLPSVLSSFSHSILFSLEENNAAVSVHMFLWTCDNLAAGSRGIPEGEKSLLLPAHASSDPWASSTGISVTPAKC